MELLFLFTTILALTLLYFNEKNNNDEVKKHKELIESQHALIELLAAKLKEAKGDKYNV
ncbi:hypothetical protein [Salirhabdus salicampi]|uniref:hypothetical protein n=1 Tax=Salirhabdus salicampi TaxID=476102 RepID=UPI0020C3EF4B|nr:hypothetical protein [Salirhabdus salicampi]MCP8617865.1 hypothetical protein [Salirhabdus salicampi]